MTNMQDEYFEWLVNMVCENKFANSNSYRKLLVCLHSIPFTWTFRKDQNRAEDGIELRYYFAYDNGIQNYDELSGPCSVLEMMLALAIRCEDVMCDPGIGDRTSQWFWRMITNLGLGGMSDRKFDRNKVKESVNILLNRDYDSHGHGGLFVVKNPEYDLRDVELYVQMLWYLNDL